MADENSDKVEEEIENVEATKEVAKTLELFVEQGKGCKNKVKIQKKYERNFCITVKCSMKMVYDHFGSNFSAVEREFFSKSPFRYFLDLQSNEIHICTSVVTQIVKSRVGKLKYNIGDVDLIFRPIDITLILGLKIGVIPREFMLMDRKVLSLFRSKYFLKSSIKKEDIKAAILRARVDPDSGDDVHRLNRLLLLSICLLPDAGKTLDVRYVDLVEDLALFDAFPWGTVVFNLLSKALEAAATNESKNKANYNLPGCVLGFIIWAYIHIPNLGPKRSSNAPFPRMLGWKNLPGKNTSRSTIDKKIYPTRGKQVEVVPAFISQSELNEEIVIEACQYQQELDDLKGRSFNVDELKGILKGVVRRELKEVLEEGVGKKRQTFGKNVVEGSAMASTSDTKFVEAVEAMKGQGIPEDTTKHVLENFCKLYGKKWRFIEAENYQVLADATFQYQDDQVDEAKKRKDTQRSGDVEPQSKRLNLMQHEDRTAGCSQSVFGSKLNERNLAQTFAEGNIDEQMPNLMVVPQFNLDSERPPHDLEDIAKGEEKVKIPVVNEINDMHPPLFHYMAQNNVYENAHLQYALARIGDKNSCSNCFGDCLSSPMICACKKETGGEFAYTADGNLKGEFLDECMMMKHTLPNDRLYYCEDCPLERSKNGSEKCKGHLVRKFIKECWTKCGCNKKCGNRVVQRGITQDLQVFFTPEGKGWGLRTVKSLPKGAFVCEYVGEILTNIELYQRNEKRTGNEKHTYPMLLNADWSSESILDDEEALCLDATTYGNIARFINHRCYDANLVDIPVEIETPDHHYYHVAFFTSRAVDAMEELTWDYGIDFQDVNHPIKAFSCSCGSNLCRGMPLANGDNLKEGI